jgi:hypothetical protein
MCFIVFAQFQLGHVALDCRNNVVFLYYYSPAIHLAKNLIRLHHTVKLCNALRSQEIPSKTDRH